MASATEMCYICDMQLNWELGNKGKIKSNSPTLDRLDNEKVIRKDNVVILCYRCNATKCDRSMGEFLLYCYSVVAKLHSHFEYPQLVHL